MLAPLAANSNTCPELLRMTLKWYLGGAQFGSWLLN